MNWNVEVPKPLIAEGQGFPLRNRWRSCGSSTNIGRLLFKPTTIKTRRFVPTNNSCACAKTWKKLWAWLPNLSGPAPPTELQPAVARPIEGRSTLLKMLNLPPVSLLHQGRTRLKDRPHPRNRQNLWRPPESMQ